ncbi:MAG: PRC-barrel domain containing protein, partial [Candidatus Wallbacteria bacterium]|nr:PRC-barrel domain containing protein [Candidatus Wallbacteria bacterium]
STQWIERVSWNELKVFINMKREVIKRSPNFTEESLLSRTYETSLHSHYGREKYWSAEPAEREHEAEVQHQ